MGGLVYTKGGGALGWYIAWGCDARHWFMRGFMREFMRGFMRWGGFWERGRCSRMWGRCKETGVNGGTMF